MRTGNSHELHQSPGNNRLGLLPRLWEAHVPGVPAAGPGYRSTARTICRLPPPLQLRLRARTTPAFNPNPVSHYFALTRRLPRQSLSPRTWGAHPVLALILGFIPGVGAIYNGQYAKGLIHVDVFGLLVSLAASSNVGGFEPLIGLLDCRMGVLHGFREAFHTARNRRSGAEVEEFSSLNDVRPAHCRFPAGAILLIALGFILLLNTTDIIRMETPERYWPVGLIVCGLYMLYMRATPRSHAAVAPNTDANGNAQSQHKGVRSMNDQSAYLHACHNRARIILITIGVLFAFDRFTEFRFSQTWPALLFVIGLLKLMGGGSRIWYGGVPPPPPIRALRLPPHFTDPGVRP